MKAVRQAFTTAAVVLGGTSTLYACPQCFSNVEETALVDGTKLGILVMLGIILAVQAGFVGFFLYLRNRAKIAADLELDNEWSQLQRH